MAVDKSTKTQILVTFPKELVKQIEDFRFNNRKPNRNAAILDLIKEGLEAAAAKKKSDDHE